MKKTNLLKSVLIPSLSLVSFSTVAVASTSCSKNTADEPDSNYMVVVAHTASIISFVTHRNDSTIPYPDLQYSYDKSTWMNYNAPIPVNKGEKIFFKGKNPHGLSFAEKDYSNFAFAGEVSVSGSVMGLIDEGLGKTTQIPRNFCFYDLFRDCGAMPTVNKTFLRNAKGLTPHCFDGMFYNCYELVNVPDFPEAEELAAFCYNFMFCGCVSLEKAPKLPGLIVSDHDWDYCYGSMFRNCTSLKEIKTDYIGSYMSKYYNNWVDNVAANGVFYYNGKDSVTDFMLPSTWIKKSF